MIMREFVAVDIGSEATLRLTEAPPHLTLKFLGEVPPERNAEIVARLEVAAREAAPFALRLEGMGAFPSSKRPRVVWLGVTTGRSEVIDLARKVKAALEPEFGSESGEFVPHLTLFRVRSASDLPAALELLDGTRRFPSPRDVRVEELKLKESKLSSKGATHRVICTIPLGFRSVHSG